MTVASKRAPAVGATADALSITGGSPEMTAGDSQIQPISARERRARDERLSHHRAAHSKLVQVVRDLSQAQEGMGVAAFHAEHAGRDLLVSELSAAMTDVLKLAARVVQVQEIDSRESV